MNRLTARSPKNQMAYLIGVKPDEQALDGSYNTLKCVMEAFNRLAEYEEAEQQAISEAERLRGMNDVLVSTIKYLFENRETELVFMEKILAGLEG